MFICCLSGPHVMVMTDDRRPPFDDSDRLNDEPSMNFLVLTVCGFCDRRSSAIDGSMRFNIHLNRPVVSGWGTYKAVSRYCGREVRFVSEIVERQRIMEESKACGMRLQTAEIDEPGADDGGQLRLLPYLELAFL